MLRQVHNLDLKNGDHILFTRRNIFFICLETPSENPNTLCPHLKKR